MAIDKSLRQHYQDGENVGPFEKGKSLVARKTETSYLDNVLNYLISNKIPGLKVQDIRDFKTGKPISKIASKILKERFGIGIKPDGIGFDFKPTDVLKVFNLSQKSGIPFSNLITKALPLGAAAAAIYYLNKNRERLTGYKTQREYEEARDIRVLEKRQTDMLNRMKRGDNYSEKNLIQVTNELAKKRGDVDADDMAFIKEIAEDPSFTGEGYDDTGIIKAPIIQDPDTGDASTAERIAAEQREIEQRNRLAEQREQDRLQREVTRQAEENAARIAAEQAAAAPPPQFAQPQDGGGGRDYGHQETRSSSGWERSPFKKGGRIDKALEGRSRDI